MLWFNGNLFLFSGGGFFFKIIIIIIKIWKKKKKQVFDIIFGIILPAIYFFFISVGSKKIGLTYFLFFFSLHSLPSISLSLSDSIDR